jgi:hypothetical protein
MNPHAAHDRKGEAMNVVWDVTQMFGASGSNLSVDGAIAAGSATLNLAEPGDFANGQGVWIPHAGPLSPLPAPDAPRVFVVGGPHGTSTYAYTVVALDDTGGMSPASSPGVLTTGPATLGGLGADGSGEGQVLSQARFLGVTVTPVSGAHAYAVYRTQAPPDSGLATGFLGIYRITNTPFLDYGQPVQAPPPGVSATPNAAALGQSLVSTVLAGGGSTMLTLADTAVTAYAGPIYHDDTAALQLAYSRGVPALFHPPGSYGVSASLTYAVAGGTLFGSGPASVLRFQGTTAAGLVVTGSGTTVRDLAFDGQNLVDTLLTVDAANVSVLGTTGQRATTGLGAYNPGDTWYRGLSVYANVYTDCTYSYSVTGYWADVVLTGNRSDFRDVNLTGRGVNLHNAAHGGHPAHWLVSGNVVRCRLRSTPMSSITSATPSKSAIPPPPAIPTRSATMCGSATIS